MLGRIAVISSLVFVACSGDGGGSGGSTDGGGGSPPTCASCPGCCAGTSCVAFSQQDATTCGANGSACSACAFGFRCEKGGCVVDENVCSPASCKDGCCSGDFCVKTAMQNWAGCGSLGAKCGSCATRLACVGGACDSSHWSQDATFKLTALEIANCSCTDSVGLPDPFVTLQSPSSSGSTNHCQDVVGCKFSSGSIDVTAADLIAGKVSFQIYDEDSVYDDSCGGGALKLPAPIPVKPSYEVSVGTQKFTFKLDAK